MAAITTRTHVATCEAITSTVDHAIASGSTLTIHDLVAMADQLIADGSLTCTCGMDRTVTRVVVDCTKCGHPIAPGASDTYVHVDAAGLPLDQGRGCRSASFSRDGDWDASMDRRWQAKP